MGSGILMSYRPCGSDKGVQIVLVAYLLNFGIFGAVAALTVQYSSGRLN